MTSLPGNRDHERDSGLVHTLQQVREDDRGLRGLPGLGLRLGDLLRLPEHRSRSNATAAARARRLRHLVLPPPTRSELVPAFGLACVMALTFGVTTETI